MADPTPKTHSFVEQLHHFRHEVENTIAELIPDDETVTLRTRLIFEEAVMDANNNAYISEVDEFGVIVTMDSDPDYNVRVPFVKIDIETLIEVLQGVELATS